MKSQLRSVSEVAGIFGLSVRTLHHYDEIGLLVPSARSMNGYRRYSDEDVCRLSTILAFKRLGFSLDAVQRLLDDPAIDRVQALETQRAAIENQLNDLQAILHAVNQAIDVERKGTSAMSNTIIDNPTLHDSFEAEARERWGNTEAYKISMQRAKDYTPEDWAAIKAEREAIAQRLADLMAQGKPPSDEAVIDVVEEHRAHLERWFYPCSKAMHRGLGCMYADDPRFAALFEKLHPGLSSFVAEAFAAHAEHE